MSQSDRAIKKLATQLARLDREVKSWRGAQADYTSIEAGTMDINDSDGNLVSRVGYQEDGSGAVRFFDGPVPPVPSGVTASADGPIIQATWDGSFEGGAEATYDLAYLEVAATQVDDDSNVSFATITAKEGASASVVADVTGDWVVAVRSVSQAGKKSEFATAGTVEVKLTDVAGAIEAVQDSANGKNKVTYSSHAPTENDPGIFDDTWFVGQVGRPNDVIEATNLVSNPSFEAGVSDFYITRGTLTSEDLPRGRVAVMSGTGSGTTYMSQSADPYPLDAGKWVAASLWANSNGQVRYRWATYGGSTQYVLSDYVSANDERVSHSFQIPAGQSSFLFTFQATPGSTGTRTEVDDVVIATADSKAAAEAKVATYFDGDTPSGTTDNESHYRWTGEPHASTSEKYLPALDIGDSSNWNIIEQYRHDGTGWVRVELSHHVFSTVDLGKATVGELDGIRIMARTITGDLFTGDAFDGIVFRGNTFTTRDGNGEFSDRGLFFQKPDGTSIFRVPTDGTPISMSASDVQIERAQVDEIDLNIGRVRSGGLFELSSGVTPPASPPELNAAWERDVTLEATPDRPPHAWEALAYWDSGDVWVRTVNIFGATSSDPDMLELYDPDTGEIARSFNIGLNPTNGVTIIGDIAYILGDVHSSSNQKTTWVYGYDLNTGDRTSRFEFPGLQSGRRAALCSTADGMLVNVVVTVAGDGIAVRTRNPVTGVEDASRSWNTDWPKSAGTRLEGAALVGDMLYVTDKVYTRSYQINGSSLDRVEGLGWANPNRDGAGMVWVDDHPFVVDGSGVVFEGSTRASDYSAEVCYTWYDGTHETTPSPVASIDVAARETVTITLPYREGLGKRVYYRGAGGTNWVRKNVAENVTSTPLPVGVAYFQPPTNNSFPNADPAVFRSTNGNVVVRGDGSGKWGPLTFFPNGSWSGAVVSGQVVITSPSANSTTSVEVTFPPGRFTNIPEVTTTVYSNSPRDVSVGVRDVSATSFTINMFSTASGPRRVAWIAFDQGA